MKKKTTSEKSSSRNQLRRFPKLAKQFLNFSKFKNERHHCIPIIETIENIYRVFNLESGR